MHYKIRGVLMFRVLLCFLFACIIQNFSFAQQTDSVKINTLTNIKIKNYRVALDTLVLDELSIVPASVSVENIAAIDYWIDYFNAVLYWKKKPDQKNVVIRYRVFPYKINMQTQKMNFDSLMNFSVIRPMPVQSENRELINFGNIKADGSFGREIGFGNNQSAVLNSDLNVRLSGMLGDSIMLEAAIADNNIPFQPEGNTQQLNQFDRVFVKFQKDNWQLELGDMDLRQNDAYFLNFYKRLQGVQFRNDYKISKNINAKTLINGSIAKGKFSRNTLTPLEGNQGPYRLTGESNEVYFIVLANSERVYLNGELLQRGEDQDYVINYNTAEITFTPQKMITKDSRIQVEFEYADKNYLNANVFIQQQLKIKDKLKINMGYFNNSDAKNTPITQNLDTKQKQFLHNIGDSIQNAFYPSVQMDTAFSSSKTLYKKIFIYEQNILVDSFYQYSINKDSAIYSVAFSDVGLGRGNYVLDANNANGRVYKYMAPVNGVKQGQFEPVMQLIAPKKHEMVNLGMQFQMTKNTSVGLELASSNFDINTFSSLNKKDNRGFAAKLNITDEHKISKKKWWYNTLEYEYVQDKFKPLERLRNIEFERDWSLPLSVVAETENIGKITSGLKDSVGNILQYQFVTYNRAEDYKGFQNKIKQVLNKRNWSFLNEITLTNFKTDLEKGYFFRPNLSVSKSFPALKNWSVGAAYSIEHNEIKNRSTDTLNAQSFSFNTLSFSAKSNPLKENKYEFTYYTRTDKYPYKNQLEKGDRSNNINIQAVLLKNEKHQFYINATYRTLKIFNDSLSNNKAENTILSRVEYRVNEWKGFLKGFVLYEMGTGQEQKRAYTFVEVPLGRGTHTWIDYNGDGVQQLNEFEIAAFMDQANFMKLFTPTNEYIKANYNNFSYNLLLDPRVLWSQKEVKGLRKFVTKFNISSSINISKKAAANNHFDFNPFDFSTTKTELISFSKDAINAISFNRYHIDWGVDFSNSFNAVKGLLNYGYETNERNLWTLRLRKKISTSFTLSMLSSIGYNSLSTENSQFQNRNYDINKWSIESSLTFVRKSNFRLNANYKYQQKENGANYGGEKAKSNAFQLESKYNVLQDGAINTKFTYENIQFKTLINNQNTVQYIMLDGLQAGQNYLWNITLTKRLFGNLEVNIQYDGRKAGDTKTVHSGRAAIRAIL